MASTPKRKKTDGADPAGVSATTPGSSTRKVCHHHCSNETKVLDIITLFMKTV